MNKIFSLIKEMEPLFKKYLCKKYFQLNVCKISFCLFPCLIFFQIPFIIMIFCYMRMFREIKAHSKRLEETSNQEPYIIFLQVRAVQSVERRQQRNLIHLCMIFSCPQFFLVQCSKRNRIFQLSKHFKQLIKTYPSSFRGRKRNFKTLLLILLNSLHWGGTWSSMKNISQMVCKLGYILTILNHITFNSNCSHFLRTLQS